jgi:phosphotransferase system  glucose/maltose/N-acetylglucosamine-specific IIC component
MFGRENELLAYLVAMGLATAALTALLTWLAGWRYGRRRAIVVPILALVALGILMVRVAGEGGASAMDFGAFGMIYAGPVIAGGLVGLVLSRRG